MYIAVSFTARFINAFLSLFPPLSRQSHASPHPRIPAFPTTPFIPHITPDQLTTSWPNTSHLTSRSIYISPPDIRGHPLIRPNSQDPISQTANSNLQLLTPLLHTPHSNNWHILREYRSQTLIHLTRKAVHRTRTSFEVRFRSPRHIWRVTGRRIKMFRQELEVTEWPSGLFNIPLRSSSCESVLKQT